MYTVQKEKQFRHQSDMWVADPEAENWLPRGVTDEKWPKSLLPTTLLPFVRSQIQMNIAKGTGTQALTTLTSKFG